MHPINLGMSYNGPLSSPPAQSAEPEEYFPTTRLEFKDAEVDLPDEGTITFRYKVTREVEEKKADRCCYELDLVAIVGVKGKKEMKDERESAGSMLDKLKAELESEYE